MQKIKITGIVASLFIFHFYSASVLADGLMPDKTSVCASCHGALGVSIYDLWPNIAGQKKTYLVRQLKAFRNGGRYDPWMTPMAVPLSDSEIEELARFYSTL